MNQSTSSEHPPLPTDRWRVWVTRDEGPTGPLCTALRAAGREPVLEPVVAVKVARVGTS